MEFVFPPEIWLKILKRVDRPKLMELRLVCRYFYNVIEDILNKSPEWKNLMVDATMFEFLTLTMQRAYPYEIITHMHEVHDPQIWRGSYLSFKKWQKVVEYEPTTQTIIPGPTSGEIACACTFDKYISIAFENGSIANFTTKDLSQPFFYARQDTTINQIEFWYSNSDVLVVTVDKANSLRFWNLNSKKEIVTAGFYANSINLGECRHFCIGELDGVMTSYERDGSVITPGPTLDFQIVEGEKVIAHAIDGKNMSALSYGCMIMYLYHGKINEGKLTRLVMDQEKCHIPQPHESLQRIVMPTIAFFFRIGEKSIGIGSKNYYEGEWHEYDLKPHFGCKVTSVALHAQIVMFGLEDGSIHLFHIYDYGELMNFGQTIRYAKKIQVDFVPIIDLTVLEVDKIPCIVAITAKRVHLVNFFK